MAIARTWARRGSPREKEIAVTGKLRTSCKEILTSAIRMMQEVDESASSFLPPPHGDVGTPIQWICRLVTIGARSRVVVLVGVALRLVVYLRSAFGHWRLQQRVS